MVEKDVTVIVEKLNLYVKVFNVRGKKNGLLTTWKEKHAA